jgi:hypothetical protein
MPPRKSAGDKPQNRRALKPIGTNRAPVFTSQRGE